MFDVVFFVLLAALPLGGGIVREWWFALVPLVVWPVFYLGLRQDWWLYGVGDGWQYAAVTVTLFGVVTTAIAVAVARGVFAFRHGPQVDR
jgi:hypothetical protein